jgi:hypothetical protein
LHWIAAVGPGPVVGRVAEPGSDGVLDDVTARFPQVALAVDDTRFEPAGEEMAEAAVSFVEPSGVAAVQALETSRQVDARRMENQVVVRGHQAERVDHPAVALHAELHESQERSPILVVAEDRAAVDASSDDVEVAVRERASKDARHGGIEAPGNLRVGRCGQLGALSAHAGPSVADASRV